MPSSINTRNRLTRSIAEEKMQELELEMIEAFQLTLPPAIYPWERFGGGLRRDEERSA